jgi:5-hydroxyisourate hydrolase
VARLSTHVLDTSRGVPAQGVAVELHIVRGGERQRLVITMTNAEGRTDAPLLAAERLEAGVYEITFHAHDYFRRTGVALTDPPFLGDIIVRIGIANPAGDYHVPLLLSPYGYSTYRGA